MRIESLGSVTTREVSSSGRRSTRRGQRPACWAVSALAPDATTGPSVSRRGPLAWQASSANTVRLHTFSMCTVLIESPSKLANMLLSLSLCLGNWRDRAISPRKKCATRGCRDCRPNLGPRCGTPVVNATAGHRTRIAENVLETGTVLPGPQKGGQLSTRTFSYNGEQWDVEPTGIGTGAGESSEGHFPSVRRGPSCFGRWRIESGRSTGRSVRQTRTLWMWIS